MKLFSEIYSVYFGITEKILKKREVSKSDIIDIIRKNGYSETSLFLLPELISEDGYGLLLPDDNKIYRSVLKKSPHMPLTTLEKRWICAVLNDKKSCLFLDKEEREKIKELLGEKALFSGNHFCFFDRFSDGDDYENEEYIKNFRNILISFRNKTLVKICFQTRKNKRITHYYRLLKIEYSSKNDCFRVHAVENRSKVYGIINLSRINFTELTDISSDEGMYFGPVKKEVAVKVTEERNAVNRFMMEFAELERCSEYDDETGVCFVTMKYEEKDEAEILIRLLSFGPVIEVTGPDEFRKMLTGRILKQSALFENK